MNKTLSMFAAGILAALLTGCGGSDSSTDSSEVDTGGIGTDQGTDQGTGQDGGSSVSSLSPIAEYVFTAVENKIAPGKSTEAGNCSGNIDVEDSIADLNVYAVYYQNGCYTDGRYNNNDYPIAYGQLSFDDSHYDAYQVSPSQVAATNFVGSHHKVQMKFSAADDYAVYNYNSQTHRFTQLGQVTATTAGDYTPLPFIDLDTLSETLTFVVMPTSADKPTTMQALGQNVQGAYLSTMTGIADINLYSIQLDDALNPKAAEDFNQGPSKHNNVYGQNHYFDLFGLSDGGIGAIWQDKASYQYYFTRLNASQASNTIELPAAPASGDFMLAGATADTSDNLYYLLIEAGTQSHDLVAWLMKTDLNGKMLLQQDVTATIDELATFGDLPSASNQAVLKVLGNQLGVIYSGTHQNGHQWAEVEIFNTDTLALIKDHGQTASHSFSQILTTSQDESQFLSLDLGDNYPRGILLSRFDATSKQSRAVYSYKTAHSTSPNGFGVLGQNAKGETTYKWSNDNKIYTELGGLVDTGNGYLVFFASEHDSNGKVLDNAQAVDYLNNARNLGVVKVVSDFENASGSGTQISDDLMMLSGDYPAETGSFYNFSGGESLQRVAGIHWLTQLDPQDLEHNVSRVKTLSLPGKDQVLVLWEEWSQTDYLTTKAMLVGFDAIQVGSTYELPNLRLNRRDELLYQSGSVWSVSGNSADHSLQVLEFKLL
ncbi:hypothetical protein [Shewanella sp. Isolate11]|uniref:hypothetical protein n=1 Tax=Shewanella sp. Isolate11 TaxID=2908530 RepID=UPI001EFCC1D5|nr:hypothetical protein [Shewanella sp. Isolate11]MCG9697682.1 hypothetical protein [Shewanella sp. Isolate11]